MSRFPYMPLFIDAYLADTTHLSAEEHGAYLLLLMAMWRRNGSVPNDDRDLARICCVNVRRWPRVKERLLPLLTEKDGELSQKRLYAVLGELRNRNAQKRSSDTHAKTNDFNGLASPRARAFKNTKPNTSPRGDVSAREARFAWQGKKSGGKRAARDPPAQSLSDSFMEDYLRLLNDQEHAHVTIPDAGHRHLATGNGISEIPEPGPAGKIADEAAD